MSPKTASIFFMEHKTNTHVLNLTAAHGGPQEPLLATVESLLGLATSPGTILCTRLFYRTFKMEVTVEAVRMDNMKEWTWMNYL
ncbi:hypothetical protein DPMN_174870 [Dreissena polymorpha]|uniref:Uncharacterized protein n=1 Tax=Dreissena polymorpha TaxID=45954 RepID=A0A9D4IIZ9_DREPO|nr:hypothetical protein DPMN_174870 [Dreissena polymorpha]